MTEKTARQEMIERGLTFREAEALESALEHIKDSGAKGPDTPEEWDYICARVRALRTSAMYSPRIQ
jgi:hypothetical protein